MSKTTVTISICGPESMVTRVSSAIIDALPSFPDGSSTVKVDRDTATFSDRLCTSISIVYPEPKPDILALIRAWYLDPTDANRVALARLIRDHGCIKPSYYPNYQTENATYWVDNTDCICVGPRTRGD